MKQGPDYEGLHNSSVNGGPGTDRVPLLYASVHAAHGSVAAQRGGTIRESVVGWYGITPHPGHV